MNLEPCPFCGSSAEEASRFDVKCSGCGAEINALPGQAVKLWNTRTNSPTLAAAVQAEREAVDAIVVREIDSCPIDQCAVAERILAKLRVRPAPAVDVMGVVRELIEALEEALNDCSSSMAEDVQEFGRAALVKARALVAPRTAEEPSGVEDVAKRLMGFRLVPDASIPPG